MRILRFVMLLTLVFQLAGVQVVGAAAAGSDRQDDSRAYEFVGIVTDYHQTCYGAAVSDMVFVTTAGCFERDGQEVWVAFEAQAEPPTKPELHAGHWYAHPEYCLDCPAGPGEKNGPDVGVVIFDAPLPLAEFARLPLTSDLAQVRKGGRLTLVGYELEALEMNDGLLKAEFERKTASVRLLSGQPDQDSPYLRISPTPAKKGVCINGPGSPVFLGDSQQLLGIVASTPHASCRGPSFLANVNTTLAVQFVQEAIDNPAGLKPRHD